MPRRSCARARRRADPGAATTRAGRTRRRARPPDARPRRSRQSVKPPVDAPTSSATRPLRSMPERVERAGELLAAPADVGGLRRRATGAACRLPRAPRASSPAARQRARRRPGSAAVRARGSAPDRGRRARQVETHARLPPRVASAHRGRRELRHDPRRDRPQRRRPLAERRYRIERLIARPLRVPPRAREAEHRRVRRLAERPIGPPVARLRGVGDVVGDLEAQPELLAVRR